jgi:hypothetical protein
MLATVDEPISPDEMTLDELRSALAPLLPDPRGFRRLE